MFFRWCILLPLVALGSILLLLGLQRIKGDILEYPLSGKIALLIDGSPSMGATDVPNGIIAGRDVLGTRLALCANSLAEAFRGVRGPEVMILVFTEATNFRTGKWIEINPDTEEQFASMIRSLQPAWIGAGTNPVRALAEATEELGVEPDMMILCADGETEYDSNQILEWARSFGRRKEKYIPIYTLGAGTPGRSSPIPKIGPDGKPSGGNVISPIDNSIVFTEFNGRLLNDIAKETNGSYRHLERITDARDLLRSAFLRSFRSGNKAYVRVTNFEDLTFSILVATLIFLLFLTKGLSWIKTISPFRRT